MAARSSVRLSVPHPDLSRFWMDFHNFFFILKEIKNKNTRLTSDLQNFFSKNFYEKNENFEKKIFSNFFSSGGSFWRSSSPLQEYVRILKFDLKMTEF